jgi:aerobic-type carbon monoxide dehydrogenase small subunit (CoxS/CutS family)
MTGPFRELELSLRVNGQEWRGMVGAHELLLDVLRDRVGLTGAKRSCEVQVCGACTVLLDGRPTSACSCLAYEADGRELRTVEGLADDGRPSELQQAFIEELGAQCGFCTGGQLLAATALLDRRRDLTYDDVAEWMSGNLCRCGCYPAIARAVLRTAGTASHNHQPEGNADGH